MSIYELNSGMIISNYLYIFHRTDYSDEFKESLTYYLNNNLLIIRLTTLIIDQTYNHKLLPLMFTNERKEFKKKED